MSTTRGLHASADPLSRRAFVHKAGAAALAVSAMRSGTSEASTKKSDPPDPKPYVPLDPAKKIRMGIVGGGFGAAFQWHLHPNCIVHAVSDLIPKRRERLMKTYRCERSYPSLAKLILDKKIDAVAVCTGAPDHARHCMDVMNAGKHVWCCVPACHTLEEAAALKQTKERTGLKYMMAETSYYHTYAMAARDLYRQGAFGEIFYSEVEYSHPLVHELSRWWYDAAGKPTWRNGYPPAFYPTHGTAYATGVTGERVAAVSALGLCAPQIDRVPPGNHGYGVGRNPYDNPFNVTVMLFKTDKGHIVRCKVVFAGTNAGERADLYGTRMSLYTPRGTSGQPFRMHGPGAPTWSRLPDYSRRLPEPMRAGSGHGGSHPHLTHAFIAALAEDREPAIDVYEALAMGVPGIVGHQSALKGGEQLNVPNFDRHG